MSRRDPLLPNAAIVASREYRTSVGSRLFRITTVIMVLVATVAAMTPIVLRAVDSGRVVAIGVAVDDPALADRAVGLVDAFVNQRPPGADPERWTKPYDVRPVADAADGLAQLGSGRLDGLLQVGRRADGGLEFTFHTPDAGNVLRAQIMNLAAFAVSVLDYTSGLPANASLGSFHAPGFAVRSSAGPVEGGEPVDQEEAASRSFLGLVFVILILITLLIYGMWVAGGIAAEKSTRVMELIISAASPRQLLVGKVIGIGAAGLTQYLGILGAGLLVLALKDWIAATVFGATGPGGAPLVGLTPGLLLAYGAYFVLGFGFYALAYAAVGSLVSRPEDLQQVALPVSLVPMAGYLTAIVALTGSVGGPWIVAASFLPPFAPFVMLARIMVGRVEAWEIALSLGLLAASIVVVGLIAARVYAAGVLLYGQRPGLRAFLKAARRGG